MAKTSFSNRASVAAPAPELNEVEPTPTPAPAPKRAISSAVKSAVKPAAPLANKKVEVAIADETDAYEEAEAPKLPPRKKLSAPAPENEETLSDPSALDTVEHERSVVSVPSQQVEGQLDSSDFEIPSLRLVQAIGPMSEKFEAGIFVLNGETPLCDAKGPIQLVVLRIKKDFEENVPFGSEERPRVFTTMQEVHEAGLHIDWIDNKKPPVSPRATVLVAIKRPDGLEEDPSFPFEDPNGDSWALALWNLKSTGYTTAAKKFFTASEFSLKNKLHYGVWDIHTSRENRGGNLVWVPRPTRRSIDLDSSAAEFLRSLSL